MIGAGLLVTGEQSGEPMSTSDDYNSAGWVVDGLSPGSCSGWTQLEQLGLSLPGALILGTARDDVTA